MRKYLLETLLDNSALASGRGTAHYPSLVVKVTQDDENPSALGTKGVLDGNLHIIEGNESGAGGG